MFVFGIEQVLIQMMESAGLLALPIVFGIEQVLIQMMESAGLLARWRNHLYQKKMMRDCSPTPLFGSAGIIVRRPRSTKFPI